MANFVRRIGARVGGNAYLLLAFASLCWSVNHVVGRAVVGRVPPLTIATIRWLIPGIILWLVARSQIRQDWPVLRRYWRITLWLGLTGGMLFSALHYVGLQYTTALNASILNSLVPVLIVLAGALIFRDRIGLLQILGISTSLTGVIVILTSGDPELLVQLSFNQGDLIVLVTMGAFAIYVAYLRLRPPVHWLSLLFVVAVISTAGTMPFAAFEIASGQALELTSATVLAIVYVAVFPGLIAFAAWNQGVELIGPNRSGPFLHLVPLYTVALGGMFLGERLMPFHMAGLLLILCGVWLAARRPQVAGSARRAPANSTDTKMAGRPLER